MVIERPTFASGNSEHFLIEAVIKLTHTFLIVLLCHRMKVLNGTRQSKYIQKSQSLVTFSSSSIRPISDWLYNMRIFKPLKNCHYCHQLPSQYAIPTAKNRFNWLIISLHIATRNKRQIHDSPSEQLSSIVRINWPTSTTDNNKSPTCTLIISTHQMQMNEKSRRMHVHVTVCDISWRRQLNGGGTSTILWPSFVSLQCHTHEEEKKKKNWKQKMNWIIENDDIQIIINWLITKWDLRYVAMFTMVFNFDCVCAHSRWKCHAK